MTETDIVNVTEDAVQSEICLQLQEMRKRREMLIKSRIKLVNQLSSNTASEIGYHSNMDASDRKKHWDKAKILVVSILKGEVKKEGLKVTSDQLAYIRTLVLSCGHSIKSFDNEKSKFEKSMVKLTKKLVTCEWFVSFRGFTELSLANILGETGDLANYDNPAKVWKRMGCFPYKNGDETHAGRSWRIGKWHDKKLTKEQWEEFGYCPRRRSVMHMVAANIVKQCGGKNAEHGEDHIFYQRYLEAKKVGAEVHPDWTPGHLNSHGLLLCGKRVLRELWIKWNPELAWKEGVFPHLEYS